jgi:Na+/melibiose symporter-like transporter
MNSLSKTTKFNYGMGQTAWAAKDTCFQFFLFFYYSQILGLSASLTGLAALLALLADGFSDPIVGQISDSFRKNKWGRRHPFMIFAIMPFCLSLLAIFNPPADLSEMQLFAWFLVWAITVRTFLTFFSVPHMALGAELSSDYTERTSIAVYRSVLTYFSAILIQVTAWFYLIPTAQLAGDIGEGYRAIANVAALFALVGMVAAVLGTRKQIQYLPETTSDQQSRPWYCAFSGIIGLLKQPSARVLLAANLVMITAMGVGNTMFIHVNTYFYGFSSEQTGVFMLCVLAALVPASWIAMKWTRVLGKRRAIVYMITAVAVLAPIPFMLHLYGFLAPAGSGMLLLVVGGFIFITQSFYIAHLTVAGSMLPDIADEIELSSGLRQEGMLNSAMMLCQKVTFGLGVFIAGLAIDFAGFKGRVESADVTYEMLSRMAWIGGPGLACFTLLGAFIYSRYPLTHNRFIEIREHLDGRQVSMEKR